MHNTGNPLPSKDILDLYDNSEVVDNFVNSQQDEVPDRFGTKRLTLAGLTKRSMALRNEINDFSGALTFKPEWSDVPMNVSEGVGGEGGALNLQAEALGNRSEINKITSREALRRTYLEAGYNLVEGSFESGGELDTIKDVVLHAATGLVYRWDGGLPKFIPAGSTPGDTGGINPGAWGLAKKRYVFDICSYGAVPDGLSPINTSGLGAFATGTDNTAAIKACIADAQLVVSGGGFQGSIDPTVEVIITASNIGKYRIDGTNPFGWQYPQGTQTTNIKMIVDLNGSTILWNIPENGVFIDNAYALYAPKFKNFSLFAFGFIGKRGIFFRTNNLPTATFNPLQMPVFENLVVRGGSSANENRATTLNNHFDAIFDITPGTNLCDRGLVNNCMFYQWKTFFRSSNPESVGWRIGNASTLMTYVDGAVLCTWWVPWSGGMSFRDSDIIMKGPNQILFISDGYNKGQYAYNSGEIDISCRIETNNTGVKLVQGTHGMFRFENANFSAGNSSPSNNVIGDVLGLARISFRGCNNIPNKVTLSAFSYADQYPSGGPSVYVAPDCKLVNDILVIDRVLVWGSGSPLEYIAAITAGYYIPGVLCDTENPFMVSRPPINKTPLRYRTLLYGFNDESGRSTVNADNNGYWLTIPPLMVVDKISIYAPAVSTSVADSIGVYLNDILFHTFVLSPSAPTRVSGLPTDKVITNSSESKVNLSFKLLLAGSPQPGRSTLFKAFIRVRGFIDKFDIDPTGRAVLISDRNPSW